MVQTVNRKELIGIIAKNQNITRVQAETYYDAVLNGLDEAIQTGKRVLVGDMFRLQAVMRAGGIGINPKTKERIERQPSPRLKVTLSTAYADKVKAAVENSK